MTEHIFNDISTAVAIFRKTKYSQLKISQMFISVWCNVESLFFFLHLTAPVATCAIVQCCHCSHVVNTVAKGEDPTLLSTPPLSSKYSMYLYFVCVWLVFVYALKIVQTSVSHLFTAVVCNNLWIKFKIHYRQCLLNYFDDTNSIPMWSALLVTICWTYSLSKLWFLILFSLFCYF